VPLSDAGITIDIEGFCPEQSRGDGNHFGQGRNKVREVYLREKNRRSEGGVAVERKRRKPEPGVKGTRILFGRREWTGKSLGGGIVVLVEGGRVVASF